MKLSIVVCSGETGSSAKSLYDDIRAAFDQLNTTGIVHNDAHTLNYMLSDVAIEPCERGECVTDGRIWVIDFGRSVYGSAPKDSIKIEADLKSKIDYAF